MTTAKKKPKRKYKRKKTAKKVTEVKKEDKKLGEALVEAAGEALEDVKKEKKPKKRVRPKRNIIGSKKAVTSFKAWFTNALDKDSRIKPHHFTQLLIYMQGIGIRERDTIERFESGLKTFFGE